MTLRETKYPYFKKSWYHWDSEANLPSWEISGKYHETRSKKLNQRLSKEIQPLLDNWKRPNAMQERNQRRRTTRALRPVHTVPCEQGPQLEFTYPFGAGGYAEPELFPDAYVQRSMDSDEA